MIILELAVMHKSLIQKAEDYVKLLLTQKTPAGNYYHNLEHTKDVVQSANEIAIGEKVNPDDMEIIQIAAWFHDTGYVEKSGGHEELSSMFASNFLTEENYSYDKTDEVVNCILATKVPQSPKNHFQRIICDADLNHLGRRTFFLRNDIFRMEVEFYSNRKLSDYDWLIQTINFAKGHQFFTDYAKKYFTSQKNENISILQAQLEKIINPSF